VAESPEWLRNRLLAIGQRPINNIVDITNFILHETGQPLHAFDAQQIGGQAIRVKNLATGTPFVSLDEKVRSLHAEDLMICDAEDTPLCIGGVFGGLHSGVSATTTDVFLESAWFHPVSIRKSSVRHGLRTDAAARFEKGVDISQTVQVLKRAASLIKEVAGGTIAGALIDIYPNPEAKKEVALKYHFLKKLSGKNYHPDAVKKILGSLGFTFLKEGADDLWFDVPYHKPDIHHPADLVEEIMRIDGLDNVEIPAAIHIAPAADVLAPEENWQQKVSEWLAANGFNEIFTNSITNSKYYSEAVLATAVKMLNNLSVDLDIMRPSMLETGLETVAHNLNRRNRNLCLFELGKTYSTTAVGSYQERKWLTLLVTGEVRSAGWRSSAVQADFFFVKGVVLRLLELMGIAISLQEGWQSEQLQGAQLYQGRTLVATVAQVKQATLRRMDIKQPVWYAELPWQVLVPLAANRRIAYREVPKFPNVERDLALVVGKQVSWQQMQQLVGKAKAPALERVALFDVFESDKLGADKKSMALNFRFQHAEKTLTDAEVDGAMQKIASLLEMELQAEVRK
jgi:phenylalanyl-tRNA synthetase beta chain